MHYGRYYAMYFTAGLVASAFSELCATVAPDAELGNIMNSTTLSVMVLFAGFLGKHSHSCVRPAGFVPCVEEWSVRTLQTDVWLCICLTSCEANACVALVVLVIANTDIESGE